METPQVKQFLIYLLIDPGTRLVRYVGQSRVWLSRPYEHFSERGNPELVSWVRGLKAEGLLPVIDVIEEFNSFDDLDDREDFWIRHFWFTGSPLLNVRFGRKGKWGGYLRGMPQTHRNSISKSRIGLKDSEETRMKKSLAVSGMKNPMSKGHSDASKQKMRNSWILRKARANV